MLLIVSTVHQMHGKTIPHVHTWVRGISPKTPIKSNDSCEHAEIVNKVQGYVVGGGVMEVRKLFFRLLVLTQSK